MEDTTFTLINVKDDIVFNLDNTTSPVKVATFRLGKTGPYTERMTPQEYLDGELRNRVARLQAQLAALPL
jgi:flavodoxin